MRVIWTDAALIAIERAYDYVYAFNPVAAEKVATEIRKTGNGLANFPQSGRPVHGTTMREVVTRYPYVIRYRIVGEDVIILRVRHTARRPAEP